MLFLAGILIIKMFSNKSIFKLHSRKSKVIDQNSPKSKNKKLTQQTCSCLQVFKPHAEEPLSLGPPCCHLLQTQFMQKDSLPPYPSTTPGPCSKRILWGSENHHPTLFPELLPVTPAVGAVRVQVE
jgi:hypothetical protein